MTVVKQDFLYLNWGQERVKFQREADDEQDEVFRHGVFEICHNSSKPTAGWKWSAEVGDELTSLGDTPQAALNGLRERMRRLTMWYIMNPEIPYDD